jgi:hypothetical protein
LNNNKLYNAVKKILTVYLLLAHVHLFGQFADEFSDGDFVNNPTWSGDNEFFVIEDNRLRSNGPNSADVLSLSTPSIAMDMASWEFMVKLDFAPSASNQVKVYLVSDQANLEGDLNGYFIEIGQSSDDVIKFRRQNGGNTITVFTGSTIFTGEVLVRIRVTRDDLGQWEVFSDPTGNDNFSPEGAAFLDDTFTSSHFFGVVCKHTSTRSNGFFFDDFLVSVVPDTLPPVLGAIEVISFTQIAVQFDEPLDEASAELASNYLVDGGIGQAISADLDVSDPSLVHLIFANSFTNGTAYVLTTKQIADQNFNRNDLAVGLFHVLVAEAAAFRDLVINEIMADNTPAVGLPEADYVEIYNRSEKFIDLSKYALSGAEMSEIPVVIAPGAYLILCANSSVDLLQPFGEVLGLSSWNALNQEDETVTIMELDNALIIDELIYDKSWYHDPDKEDGGWSLELIDPTDLCGGAANWTASANDIGGTPGKKNAVFDDTPDLMGPQLLSILVLSRDQLALTFDETLDADSFVSAIFSIAPAVTIDRVVLDEDLLTVTVEFAEPLKTSTRYTMTVNLLKDCNGNMIATDQGHGFLLTSMAGYKQLIISEIFADPSPVVGLPDAEYVELYNNSDQYFDLKDYTLNEEAITSTYILAPGEYVVLVHADDLLLFSSLINVVGLDNWDVLSNSGEEVNLKTREGEVIDLVAYDTDWYQSIVKNEGGWSLELIDPQNSCGEERNWSASIADLGGTPGVQNAIFGSKPDLIGPILLSAIAITQDSLILTFDEQLDIDNYDLGQYSIDPPLDIDHASISEDLREITMVLADPIAPAIPYRISARLLKDCAGNLIDEENSKTFALSEQAQQGDLLINELLYNPITSGGDFVELYNHSSKYINLRGWKLANGSAENPQNIEEISSEHLLMAPKQYLIFTEEPGLVAADYPSGVINNFVQVSTLPSFPNDGQAVLLLNDQAEVHDYFQYENDMQHSLLGDDKGVSLERISFNESTNDTHNWHSAASSVGFATPGYANSQGLNTLRTSAENIVVSPEVFLPNQSGISDFTTLSYAFDQPGFVANICVVDAIGRPIRALAQNELLATTGFFQWDGTTDNGRKARSGIYVMLVEIFDLSGKQHVHKKRVVIAPEL